MRNQKTHYDKCKEIIQHGCISKNIIATKYNALVYLNTIPHNLTKKCLHFLNYLVIQASEVIIYRETGYFIATLTTKQIYALRWVH